MCNCLCEYSIWIFKMKCCSWLGWPLFSTSINHVRIVEVSLRCHFSDASSVLAAQNNKEGCNRFDNFCRFSLAKVFQCHFFSSAGGEKCVCLLTYPHLDSSASVNLNKEQLQSHRSALLITSSCKLMKPQHDTCLLRGFQIWPPSHILTIGCCCFDATQNLYPELN